MIRSLSNTVGVVLTNVEDAPISLKGMLLENTFDIRQEVIKKLIGHYK